ncbi:hypothetical protein, partial [Bacillus cereus group sp. BcHK114]
HLKKNEKYKLSNFKDLLAKYNSNNKHFIDKFRKENTHSMSIHISKLNESIKNNEKEQKEIMRNNANYMDTIQLKPIVKDIIRSIKSLYCILEQFLNDFYEDITQFDNQSIPMLKEYITPVNIKSKAILEMDQNYIEDLKVQTFYKIATSSKYINQKDKQLLFDIAFRLEEVQKCIYDSINIFVGTFFNRWYQEIGIDLRPNFDDKC